MLLLDAMATQWRIALGPGGAVHTGLDYAALAGTAGAIGIPLDADTFEALRVLERAAMTRLNER